MYELYQNICLVNIFGSFVRETGRDANHPSSLVF